MATLLSMMKERMRGFFIKPENQEYRDARAEAREVRQEELLEKKETAAETAGDVRKVALAMKKMEGLDEKRAFKIIDQLVQVRLIMSKQLRLLGYIKHAIADDLSHDAALNEEQRYELAKNFEEEFRKAQQAIESLIDTIFQEETGFQSINTSLEQFESIDSQAKALVYNYLKAKRLAKRTNRDENGIMRKSRVGKEIESPAFVKRITLFRNHLNEEMRYLKEASKYTFQLLRDDIHDIESKEDHFKRLMAESGFPHNVGEDVIKSFDAILKEIHSGLQQEIAKKRIELSEVKRAA